MRAPKNKRTVKHRNGEPSLQGLSEARRALCLLLQLKPREEIVDAHLSDYDRFRRELVDIVLQPFLQLLRNDSAGAPHEHEG